MLGREFLSFSFLPNETTSSRKPFPSRILPTPSARRRIITLIVPLCRYPSVRTLGHRGLRRAEELASYGGPLGQARLLVITTWVQEPAIGLKELIR